MQKVGLTGGIGSGKSAVATLLRLIGVPVYDADSRAKSLMTSLPELRDALTSLLGAEAFHPDDTLNRRFIASRVFSDDALLARLNTTVHPYVHKDFESWTAKHVSVPYVVEEAAVLIESGAHEQMDRIIIVTAPVEVRVRRVMARDGVSEHAVKSRINRQMSDQEKIPYADFILINDGVRSLIRQVMDVHKAIVFSAAAVGSGELI